MEELAAYIPMDRLQAISRGRELPDRAQGTALFADISGFTPLTEALVRALGPRRGADELTRQLNRVYDALVAEVRGHGGSVIGFGGDAVTCWFDLDGGSRATACGLAMQAAMRPFGTIDIPQGGTVSLAMKVALVTGPVRRFKIGDPQIQHLDVLAGRTLDRLATCEGLAERGDILADSTVLASLGDEVEVLEWRRDQATGEDYGVVSPWSSLGHVAAPPWPALPSGALTEIEMRPWLLPPVYDRLGGGGGRFLAEIRPAVALFLTFGGLDYDRDPDAESKLDAYVRWVQNVLARYQAYLFYLAVGDKGSHLYAAFGAPIAHEDDTERAVSAAFELIRPPAPLEYITNVRIGMSQGRMRTGAYGGTTRCTYGVIGDDVNLAARLMQSAAPGQILVSRSVQQATATTFTWESLPDIQVKGKAEPVTVFGLVGTRQRHTMRFHESNFALPMVGREAERALIEQKLSQALGGTGQIVGVRGEAGVGKSRLVAEVLRTPGAEPLNVHVGECESYGTNTSYLVWRPIWHGLFDIDPALSTAEQMSALEEQLTQVDPALVARLPLLGALLNLPIPDNELTNSFDAELRKTSLEAMLVDYLRACARTGPLVIVLEDSHWMDSLSRDLVETVAHAIVDLPVLLLLVYRPAGSERFQAWSVEQLAHFTEIELGGLVSPDSEQLISLKLEQLFGSQMDVSPTLIERVTARAQGNPFYVEELLNYLHGRGENLQGEGALERVDLPASLDTLVLSRLDQLAESQRTTIRVASIIGRLFRAALLWGMYPELGEAPRVKADLEALSRLNLVILDTPEPELAYLFRHIITQEVTYQSLPYATRAVLHEQLAQYIERTYGRPLEQYLDLLAFHYDRTENIPKRREYLRKAGEAAQGSYANEAAMDYFQRLLPLLSSDEQVPVMLRLGEVLELVGRWREADELYERTLALAEQLGDRSGRAWCQTAMGALRGWKQDQYAEASACLEQAHAGFDELGDQAGVGQVLHYRGTLAAQQGDYEAACGLWQESLDIRRRLDDRPRTASLLSNLGLVAHWQGDFASAQELYEESLEIRQQLGDRRAIAVSLNNLGYLCIARGDYATARTHLEAAVGIQREIGDRSYLADALTNLGNVARDQGDYPLAHSLYSEGLTINRELGNQLGIAYSLEEMAGLAALRADWRRALRLAGAASKLRETIGAPLPPAEETRLSNMLAPAYQALVDTAAAAEAALGRDMPIHRAIEVALAPDQSPADSPR